MKYFLGTLFVLMISVANAGTLGQRTLRFEAILTQDSLNGSEGMGAARSILEDHTGFMWFAGEKGLARFDGHFWKIFRHGDYTDLPSSAINDLALGAKGLLWVATEKGLVSFDNNTQKFARLTLDNTDHQILLNKTVTSLVIDQFNNLVVGGPEGMLFINSDRKRSLHYVHTGDQTGLTENFIRKLMVDKKNRIWIATDKKGVNVFNRVNESFIHIVRDLTQQEDTTSEDDGQISNLLQLPDNRIRSMIEDDRGNVWLGSYEAGVSVVNERGRVLRNIYHELGNIEDANKPVVWDLLQDEDNIMWMAPSKGGLAFYNAKTGVFEEMSINRGNAIGFDASSSIDLYQDSRGDLWVSQFPFGIVCLKRITNAFKNFTAQNRPGPTLSHNDILSLQEKDNQTLWVGTEKGLNLFHLGQQKFVDLPLPDDLISEIATDTILSMSYDKRNRLWLGTWSEGLKVWDSKEKKLIRYDSKNTDLGSDIIWKVYVDRAGDVWAGTEGAGLFRFNENDARFSEIPQSIEQQKYHAMRDIRALFEDSEGVFWVGGYGGLDRFDKRSQSLHRFPMELDDPDALHAQQVSTISEDQRGRLWVGTYNHGINILSEDRQQVLHITKKEGLPSNRVTSITFDQKGRGWAGTTFGVAMIDMQSLDVTPYRSENGLVSNYFYRDASFSDRKGYIYFGSAEGLSVWHPNELIRTIASPTVKVIDVNVSKYAERSSSLAGLFNQKHISVPANHTSFRLRFSSLDYWPRNLTKFEYRLLGFDDDWRRAGGINQTTYTNLNSGYYVFQVRASDKLGKWVGPIEDLGITILTHWWKSWWALCLYLLCALLLLVFIWWLKLRSVIAVKDKEAQAKLRAKDNIVNTVLASVTNELRPSMNRIAGLTESITRGMLGDVNARDIGAEASNQLRGIYLDARRLIHFMDDMQAYSLVMGRPIAFNKTQVNMHDSVEQSVELIRELAQQKEISLVNAIDQEHSTVLADEDALSQILKNILSIFLQAAQQGSITIDLSSADGDMDFDRIRIHYQGPPLSDNIVKMDEVLFRTKDVTDDVSLGDALSFALAKQLTELQGGQLLRACPYAGDITFMICLPTQEFDALKHDNDL